MLDLPASVSNSRRLTAHASRLEALMQPGAISRKPGFGPGRIIFLPRRLIRALFPACAGGDRGHPGPSTQAYPQAASPLSGSGPMPHNILIKIVLSYIYRAIPAAIHSFSAIFTGVIHPFIHNPCRLQAPESGHFTFSRRLLRPDCRRCDRMKAQDTITSITRKAGAQHDGVREPLRA